MKHSFTSLIAGISLLAASTVAYAENTETFDPFEDVHPAVLEHINDPSTVISKAEYIVKPKLSYPVNLKNSGNDGKVRLKVWVDAAGNVSKLETLFSTHPELEKVSVSAMLQSKFKPLTINGIAYPTQMCQEMAFSLSNVMWSDSIYTENDSGMAPFKMPKASSKLPADLQFDQAAQILVATPVVYPRKLLADKKNGKAKVMVIVDPNGDIYQVKLLSASQPEFGAATVAAMQTWKFKPAYKDGKPTWSVFNKEQQYSIFDRDAAPNSSARKILKELQQEKPEIYSLNQLDRMPKALYAPMPDIPVDMQENNVTGHTLVEFFVDKQGYVELPDIVSSDNQALGWLALASIKRWQFEVPTVQGKPVVARVKLPVNFE